MSLLSTAQRFLPSFLGGFRRPQGKEVLSLRPLRHPKVQWTRTPEDDLVVLTVTRSGDLLSDFAAKVFSLPPTRRIELTDEISSYVWTCCDGERSVSEIAADIAQKYKLNKRQSEVSVLTFLRTLQTKQLIGVPATQARAYTSTSRSKDPEPRAELGRKEAVQSGNKKRGKRNR